MLADFAQVQSAVFSQRWRMGSHAPVRKPYRLSASAAPTAPGRRVRSKTLQAFRSSIMPREWNGSRRRKTANDNWKMAGKSEPVGDSAILLCMHLLPARISSPSASVRGRQGQLRFPLAIAGAAPESRPNLRSCGSCLRGARTNMRLRRRVRFGNCLGFFALAGCEGSIDIFKRRRDGHNEST